ncbi:MAG: hypothetical protein LBE59_02365 [Nevskiaceae bacterium]|nr:hypothetical protein [Nevskiaceae bacterium]
MTAIGFQALRRWIFLPALLLGHALHSAIANAGSPNADPGVAIRSTTLGS